jgi:hypothetical protein
VGNGVFSKQLVFSPFGLTVGKTGTQGNIGSL